MAYIGMLPPIPIMNIKSSVHSDQFVNSLIESVTRSTYSFLKANLKTCPPLGEKDVELVFDPRHPIVYWPINADKYVIGLNVNGNYPLQMIYQIAHELCHIFIDPRINGIFIEVMCQKTAIDVLEAIGSVFMHHNPASVTDYILNLKREIADKFGMEYMKLDESWIKKNYKIKCDARSIFEREFNQAIAFKLKDLIDTEDKFGTINVIRSSITSGYDPDTTNLNYYDSYTNMDFEKLEENLKANTGKLIKALLV